MPAVLKLCLNSRGVDYIVGDIHGAFDELWDALNQVNFNPAVDRLFLVGDLADRGNYSKACRELLKEPWVFAVQGNHERIFINLFKGGKPNAREWDHHARKNGLAWTYKLTPEERESICTLFEALPYAIEFPSTRGTVGIVHAEVPPGMTWPEFLAELEAGNPRVIEFATWGRKRVENHIYDGVRGIGRLFCGHTIHDGISQRGNTYYIDTAAFLKNYGRTDGHLSMVNALVGTQVLVSPKSENSRHDLKLGFGIGNFGNYAK